MNNNNQILHQHQQPTTTNISRIKFSRFLYYILIFLSLIIILLSWTCLTNNILIINNLRIQPSNNPKLSPILTQYLHQIHSNTKHQRLRFVCDESMECGGLADRIKGIMSSFTLSLLLSRKFEIDSRRDYDLNELYHSGNENMDWSIPKTSTTWSELSSPNNKVLLINCMNQLSCNCLVKQLYNNYQDLWTVDIILIRINQDCSGALIRNKMFRSSWLKQYMSTFSGTYLRDLYEFLFKPKPILFKAIATALQQSSTTIHYPSIVLHIRLGGVVRINGTLIRHIPSDARQEAGEQNELIDIAKRYTNCLQHVLKYDHLLHLNDLEDNNNGDISIYIAGDYEDAISITKHHISNSIIVFGNSKKFTILTGEAIGGLGHIERKPTMNGHIRAHAEFEILRNAQHILAGESGFSMYAWRIRHQFDASLYDAFVARNNNNRNKLSSTATYPTTTTNTGQQEINSIGDNEGQCGNPFRRWNVELDIV
jgi:hypothetical protein